jgi:glycosyltransferase involved in cell wall biosynthesis
MRVAIDARHLGQGRGIARYLEEMLTALAADFPDDEWVAVVPGDRNVEVPNGVELRRTRLGSRPLFAAAALTGRPRLEKLAGGADVCWLPAPAPVACGRRVPYVLTVHDISFELHPEDFTAYEQAWHKVARPRRLAERAARVVVDSKATARDLEETGWPVDPAELTVIPAAPVKFDLDAPSEDPDAAVAGPYLLYVGALEPRKGIATLAEAIPVARRAGLTVPLIVVGEGRMRANLEGIAGVRLLGRQSDARLARLYAGATALIMPSSLEGFGLPPLEAALYGVPSVTSDLPVFQETLGSAALTFPVGDAAALGKALVLIGGDANLRARLGAEAEEAVRGLTWTNSAAALRSVLADATGKC